MANNNLWTDSYWLLLMQACKKKPDEVKSPWSKTMVDLAIELHIHPKTLFEKMEQLLDHKTASLQKIWDTYTDNTRRLNKDAKRVREMKGFGDADSFFMGVESTDSFETFYLPVADDTKLTPAALTILIDLYFMLTPNTMVEETPEVADVARMLTLTTKEVVDVLSVFQTFDPILKRKALPTSPIVEATRRTWDEYANDTQNMNDKKERALAYYHK